jgi:tetratricopeptide (TPR) repeat protein
VAFTSITLAIVVVAFVGADLPVWAPFAFIASFPLYAFLLKALAKSKFAKWEESTRSRIARGGALGPASEVVPDDALLRLYHREVEFLERAATIAREHERWAFAAELLEEAFRFARDAERPRIAREIWTTLRKLPERERRSHGVGNYLEAALAAPDPSWDLHQDFGDHLLGQSRFEDAVAAYEKSLRLATTNGQRFKLMTKLAVATVRTGRFGAADGWLHEAHEIMPTGDPGYEALYSRTVEELAEAKHSHGASGDFNLVQLTKGLAKGKNQPN